MSRQSIELRRENPVSLRLIPKNSSCEALLIHGYGGSKEEMLPLGYRMATASIGCLLIDLPGHGNRGGLFSHESARRALTEASGQSRFDALVGYSAGALLAAASGYPAVCFSPPLDLYFEGKTGEMIKILRARRVREKKYFAGLRDVIENAGGEPGVNRICVIYGYHDLKTVRDYAESSKRAGIEIFEIKDASHQDIITSAPAASAAIDWIKKHAK